MSDSSARHSVAIVMLGINDLSGGGGAERFFADVYNSYQDKSTNLSLRFYCDEKTYKSLKTVGRDLHSDKLSVFEEGCFYLNAYWKLFKYIKKHNIKVIHIPLIAPQYLPFLWLLAILPVKNRPKITITQVDCGYSHKFNCSLNQLSIEERKSHILHRLYFKTLRLDGILTWYKAFENLQKTRQIRGKPLVRSINYYFVDNRKFLPDIKKGNTIVWAGRFITTKRPFTFIEAIRKALIMQPQIFSGWSIRMYGRGPLTDSVKYYTRLYRMNNIIHVDSTPDMDKVYAKSEIYVSTQDYENFTSLSMLEAIACGNAIIAFNHGQTNYFVKHMANGILVDSVDPVCLADALIELIKNTTLRHQCMRQSRDLVEKQHTVSNFTEELDAFFSDVINFSRNMNTQ